MNDEKIIAGMVFAESLELPDGRATVDQRAQHAILAAGVFEVEWEKHASARAKAISERFEANQRAERVRVEMEKRQHQVIVKWVLDSEPNCEHLRTWQLERSVCGRWVNARCLDCGARDLPEREPFFDNSEAGEAKALAAEAAKARLRLPQRLRWVRTSK